MGGAGGGGVSRLGRGLDRFVRVAEVRCVVSKFAVVDQEGAARRHGTVASDRAREGARGGGQRDHRGQQQGLQQGLARVGRHGPWGRVSSA